VAPVNETDRVLLPEGLPALKKVAQEVGGDLRGASRNRDGGVDAAHHRQCMFTAGLIPHIPENPRTRKRPKRGRQRLLNAAIQALRMRGERTFACNWLRVSAAQELLIVATEEGNSNIREWCGQKNAENSGAQPGTKCR